MTRYCRRNTLRRYAQSLLIGIASGCLLMNWTVSVRWIDKEMAHLSSCLGPFRINALDDFFFEPTDAFYALTGSGKTTALNEAIQILAKHIGSNTAPIIEEWDGSSDPLVVGDHDWTKDTTPAGSIRYRGPNHSRVSVNISNKHSPMIMAATLAHELTHHFLDTKTIRREGTEANEILTDLAAVYLGLGKLTLNGYETISWTQHRKNQPVNYSYKVGYLAPEDLALVLSEVCRFRSIPSESVKINLSPRATTLFGIAEKSCETFHLKQKLVGDRQCPRCGEYAKFAFSEDDDGLYCSKCGWEWIAIIRYTAEKSGAYNAKTKSLFSQVIDSFMRRRG